MKINKIDWSNQMKTLVARFDLTCACLLYHGLVALVIPAWTDSSETPFILIGQGFLMPISIFLIGELS